MTRSRLYVDLPADLAHVTRVEAARRGLTISELTAEALRAALGAAAEEARRRRDAGARTLEIARENVRRRRPTVSTDDLLLEARERRQS